MPASPRSLIPLRMPSTICAYSGGKLKCSDCGNFLGLHSPGQFKEFPEPPLCEKDLNGTDCPTVEFLLSEAGTAKYRQRMADLRKQRKYESIDHSGPPPHRPLSR